MEVWQDEGSCMLCLNQRFTFNRPKPRQEKRKNRERKRREEWEEERERNGSPQWWISSEACFITRLPVWRSAGKSRPWGAAAEIYGSLIISTNTFQYSIVQYTAPALLPGHPGPSPCTLSILLHQVLCLQVRDHKSPAANTFPFKDRTKFSQDIIQKIACTKKREIHLIMSHIFYIYIYIYHQKDSGN